MPKKAPDPLRVLIVDDQRDAGTILVKFLGRFGYLTQHVNDSRQALQAVREFRPQIILLDIAMPYMDGYEVARRVRCEDGFEATPIIVISSFDDEVHHRRAMAVRINRQLVKPCDLDTLTAAIQELVA